LDLELAEREVFISDLIILCSCADWFLRLLDGQQRKKFGVICDKYDGEVRTDGQQRKKY